MNSERFKPGTLSRNDFNTGFGYPEPLCEQLDKGLVGQSIDRGWGDLNLKDIIISTHDLVLR